MEKHSKNTPNTLNKLSWTVILLVLFIIIITLLLYYSNIITTESLFSNIYTAIGSILGLVGALLIFEYQIDSDRQKEHEREVENSKKIIEYTLNTTKEVIITIKQQCNQITNLIKDIESDYYLNPPLNEVATLNIERLKSMDISLFYKAILLTYKGDDAFAKYASLKAYIDFYIMTHKSLVETNHDICKDQHTEGLHIKELIEVFNKICRQIRKAGGIDEMLSRYSAYLSCKNYINSKQTLSDFYKYIHKPIYTEIVDNLTNAEHDELLDTSFFDCHAKLERTFTNFKAQNVQRVDTLKSFKTQFEIINEKAEKIIKEISENTNTKIHEIKKQITENNYPPFF